MLISAAGDDDTGSRFHDRRLRNVHHMESKWQSGYYVGRRHDNMKSYNVLQTEALENDEINGNSSKHDDVATASSSLFQSPRKMQKCIRCTVKFLDGSQKSFDVEKNCLGSKLFDLVCEHLDLVETDFFGLSFMVAIMSKDRRGQMTSSNRQRKWLDPTKVVRRQMMCPPYNLDFCVKFYVNDASKLGEEYTRYQYYLQVRREVYDGSVRCCDGSLALLTSYGVQADLGDYVDDEQTVDYVNMVLQRILPAQARNFGSRVVELHRMHTGQSPAEAEFNFLDHATRLEMYGADIYQASDANNLPIEIGVCSIGLKVFHSHEKVNEFPWTVIQKLSFKRRQFHVQTCEFDKRTMNNSATIIFNISSPHACKQLWKCCIEQHTFFRLKRPVSTESHPSQMISRKLFFNLSGSKFRFSGRTEHQTIEEQRKRAATSIQQRHFRRSLSSSSSSFLCRSSPSSVSRQIHPQVPLGTQITSARESPTICAYRSTNSSAPPIVLQPESLDYGPVKSSCITTKASTSASSSGVNVPRIHQQQPRSSTSSCSTPSRSIQNDVYARAPWRVSANGGLKTDSGATISRATTSRNGKPLLANEAHGFLGTSPRNSIASYSSYASAEHVGSPTRTRKSPQSDKSNSPVCEDSLVTITMRPDAHGRFGFNVKGGIDQNYPVIVSRVASGSSADKCQPRLNEGDQVILINGRDVAPMTHDEVVAFIRSARQVAHFTDLHLTIRPNVYRLGEQLEEPPDNYFLPELTRVADSVPRSDKLSQSLRLLSDSLTSGKVLTQFDLLYRKKPGSSMNECRLSINVNKNRYRDVCPYDSTRVVLQSSTTGDYINANFVNMDIPASGIINRYIACQGPLAHTCADFWVMVWEQSCVTIVMLTTTAERGRVKCHQYWPRIGESQDYGRLTVKCVKDRQTPNCSYREFVLRERMTKEERRVAQMQYTAWPDHGVPDDPKHFISFVDEVRRARIGSVDPIVVHCSAGIGRTGVLILMETASCLVEANEPVYPLDIVKTMRDQRAMLIQTPGQYTFVCDSILQAYNEGTIKPLAEYQKQR